MRLTRIELETYSALRRHPWCSARWLSQRLQVHGQHTMRNRLQALRRKGLARTNGQRGRDVRWVALDPPTAIDSIPGGMVFDVHRELLASGNLATPFELAAVLGADRDHVEAAVQFLVARGLVTQVQDRFLADHRPAVRREDYAATIRRIVAEWHAGRSQVARDGTSEHDLEALITQLGQMLA